ncbi:L-sorbose 1-dehydrogenase-like [Liolophura sinensis]|uniref:L-sorbose 1-dehydrogenase-like n=1 Tax=Liolophura sinensis TaxID=3198878 RepID=UPI003158A994
MEKTRTTDNLLPVYDYVIVGGGTAGCVLANRLSEDQSRTVLLLEAGSDDTEFPEIHVPAMCSTLIGNVYDWSYKSEPQKHACKAILSKQMPTPRGKVLGGSGSVNVLVYCRGTPEDFDQWEKMGCEGWGYEDVLPYFVKSENCTSPELLKGGVHGTGGPMAVTECLYTSITDHFIEAGKELGFKHTDNNGRDPIGVMRTQLNTDDGRRAHTAEAFLRPAMHRDNLHIATHCHVTKVLIDNKIARAVEFVRMLTGREVVRARREIILSSGTIGSAQILMLSGIGPREHLQDLGITVVADLPVGSYLQDHFLVNGIEFEIDQHSLPGEDVFSDENKRRYDLMRSAIKECELEPPLLYYVGPIATSLCEGTGFLRTPLQDPDSPNPAVQIYFFPVLHGPRLRTNAAISDKYWSAIFPGRDEKVKPGLTFLPVVSHPKSKGTLRLRSADPFDYPLIDPNYLAHPDDVTTMVEAIKLCQRFGETKAFRSLGARFVERSLPEYQGALHTDEYWAEYTRTMTQTVYHLCGTCRMGRADDLTTVTDPQLRVKGIGRLRVVDASVMPKVTSGNTNAPVVMIAEKAADMIKGVQGKKL